MTNEPEACMSGWEVPGEIDRLAIARRVYVEHAKADKGEIDPDWQRDVMTGVADSSHGVRIAQRAFDTLLTYLAENPPQCAVEAMETMAQIGPTSDTSTADDLAAMFTAAINAIRGEK